MIALRRWSIVTVLGLLLVSAMSLGVAAPAQAAMKYPDGWSPKAWVINVVSSVLAAAGDTDLQRALLANSTKYDHSFEGLEQQFKATAPANLPQTPAQYQIVADEYFLENNLTSTPGDVAHPNNTVAPTYVAGAKIPATKAQKLRKNLGAAVDVASVLSAAYTGFQVGKFGAEAFGMDVSGLCTPTFEDAGLVALITGTDCSAMQNMPSYYEQNKDAIATPLGQPLDFGGQHYRVKSGWATPGYPFGLCIDNVPEIFWDGSHTGNNEVNLGWTFPGAAPAMSGQGGGAAQCGPHPAPATWESRYAWTTALPTGWYLYTNNKPNPGQLGAGTSGTIEVQVADPDRTFSCETLGTDGLTYTGVTEIWKESDGKTPPPECAQNLPPGVGVDAITVNETGGKDGPEPVYEETVTPEYDAWRGTYPECVEGACSLRLLDKRGAAPVDCFESAATGEACNGWMYDPDKTTDFQCTYGSHDVELEECYAYANVFSPEKIAAGQAYSDPLTGAPVTGQSSPSAARETMNAPVQDPANIRFCLDNGWAAANPVEWVLVPVQCALQWAFVPRVTAVEIAVNTSQGAWDATVFGKIGDLMAPFADMPVFTGCDGIPIDQEFDWPRPWGFHWQLGASCDGPLATAATVSRVVTGGLVGAGGILALTSYLGLGVGFRGFGRQS